MGKTGVLYFGAITLVMEEREGFQVTVESLYTKKIKEISYDEEETYQE